MDNSEDEKEFFSGGFYSQPPVSFTLFLRSNEPSGHACIYI